MFFFQFSCVYQPPYNARPTISTYAAVTYMPIPVVITITKLNRTHHSYNLYLYNLYSSSLGHWVNPGPFHTLPIKQYVWWFLQCGYLGSFKQLPRSLQLKSFRSDSGTTAISTCFVISFSFAGSLEGGNEHDWHWLPHSRQLGQACFELRQLPEGSGMDLAYTCPSGVLQELAGHVWPNLVRWSHSELRDCAICCHCHLLVGLPRRAAWHAFGWQCYSSNGICAASVQLYMNNFWEKRYPGSLGASDMTESSFYMKQDDIMIYLWFYDMMIWFDDMMKWVDS